MSKVKIILFSLAALGIAGIVLVTVFLWFRPIKASGGTSADKEAIAKVTGSEKSILDFTVKDIDGNQVALRKYEGNVLLVVNVASKCGYTPQYEGLQAAYQKYQGEGFEILGFPANNFMRQEPESEKEIKEFCSLKYNVTFPMFAKISVWGDDQHPLYKFLTSENANPATKGDITWNFNKFLIDRKGNVAARFDSADTPDGEKVVKAIEAELAKK